MPEVRGGDFVNLLPSGELKANKTYTKKSWVLFRKLESPRINDTKEQWHVQWALDAPETPSSSDQNDWIKSQEATEWIKESIQIQVHYAQLLPGSMGTIVFGVKDVKVKSWSNRNEDLIAEIELQTQAAFEAPRSYKYNFTRLLPNEGFLKAENILLPGL